MGNNFNTNFCLKHQIIQCDLKYKQQNPRVAAFSISKFLMLGNGVSSAIISVVGGGPSEECFSTDHRWKSFTSFG